MAETVVRGPVGPIAIARHPIYGMLLPVPLVCFLGVLLTDLAYLNSGGNLVWLVNAEGNPTRWTFDGLSRMIEKEVALTVGSPITTFNSAIVTQWLFKVAYETLATPITYAVVGFLKREEGLDVYDRDTSFNPLALAE